MPKSRPFRRALLVAAGIAFIITGALLPGVAAAVGTLSAVVAAIVAVRQAGSRRDARAISDDHSNTNKSSIEAGEQHDS